MNGGTDILSIGEIVIDFTPGREDSSYIRHPGGAPANVAVCFARMGGCSAFCGKVGNDLFGEYLMNVLRDNGVQLKCGAPTNDAVTTMTFVTLADDGNRSFTFAQKTGAHLFLKDSDITPEIIINSKLVHTGSSMLAGGSSPGAVLRAMKLAKKNRIPVSFDLNFRALQWTKPERCREAVYKILPYVDLLKVSDEEVFLLGGEEMIFKVMEKYDVSLTALTKGEKENIVFWNEQEIRRHPVPQKAVDSTGAGDAFWGVFLYSLVSQGFRTRRDLSVVMLEKALKYGVAAGGLAVQKQGAVNSMPSKSEIEEVLPLYG